MAFTFVTWNVNSVRARLPRVQAWLQAQAPDLVCLQETKVEDPTFPRAEIEMLGYRVETFGQKTYNGVALLSRHPLESVTRGFPGDVPGSEARVIAATVAGLRVINLYVPNGQEVGAERYHGKLAWLDRLRGLLEALHRVDEPLVLCGDLNIAPEDQDVYDPEALRGTILCSEPEREKFRALLAWGLVDVVRAHHPEPGFYTWWDYRMGAFHRNWGLRIDHILATPSVAARATAVRVDREARKGEKPSDHAPLVVTLDGP